MKLDIKTPLYAVLEFEVIKDIRLNSSDKVIYSIINTLTSNKDKICYATNKYIANILNIDIRTVKYSIAKLKKYNYIIIKTNNNNKRLIKTTIANFIEVRAKKLDESKKDIDFDINFDYLEDI